jgi:hypothetical protein
LGESLVELWGFLVAGFEGNSATSSGREDGLEGRDG